MAKTANLNPDATKTVTGTSGINRTGIKTAPDMALDLIREAQRTAPGAPGGASALAEYRKTYVSGDAPVGSLPVADPAAASPSLPMANGAGSLLLDKLGERLAFERRGIRLYEGLIGKVRLLDEAQGPSVEELEAILEDERAHFRMIQEVIVQAGGDPTVLTPCAVIAGVLSEGMVQVVSDPRTSVAQCLQAMLSAELADNDGWELLRDLVASLGAEELALRMEEAREREAEHLERVRGWLAARVLLAASPLAAGQARKAGKAVRAPAKAAPPRPHAEETAEAAFAAAEDVDLEAEVEEPITGGTRLEAASGGASKSGGAGKGRAASAAAGAGKASTAGSGKSPKAGGGKQASGKAASGKAASGKAASGKSAAGRIADGRAADGKARAGGGKATRSGGAKAGAKAPAKRASAPKAKTAAGARAGKAATAGKAGAAKSRKPASAKAGRSQVSAAARTLGRAGGRKTTKSR